VNTEALQYNMLYSCSHQQKRAAEQFAAEHALSYVISGQVRIYTNQGEHVGGRGTIGLFRKNQLVKATKLPDPDGTPCSSVTIFLSDPILRKYANENNIQLDKKYTGTPAIELSKDRFIKGFFDSLRPYLDQEGQMTKSMAELKTREIIELLLRANPRLKDFLFDFSEPHKIDLELFMNQHFTYNVRMSQFAKMTGRSLATFKRDFKKIFDLSPEKWLMKKRLEEAHFLLKQKKQHPSSVYLDVGFENMSHFSFSFKKLFGYNPSSV
jgi:AraC family transcriptional regulator, exoenzyme S synthesis regulatory protein ExsA